MKKVLIGVGIGCGLLLLIGVGVMAAGGMWLKGKVEGVAESAQKIEKQQEEAKKLNAKYGFTPPPKGQPVKLTESRVKEYLAIRAALVPVMQKYEAESKKLDAKTNGQEADLGDVMKAGGMLMDMTTEIQAKWVEELDSKRMSPAEFHAITAALLTADLGKSAGEMKKGQRQMLVQGKQMLEQQVNNEELPQETRDEAKVQLAEMEQQLAELPPEDAPPSAAQQIHTANSELFARYKDQFEKSGAQGVDIFLWGYAENNADTLGDAMENALQDFNGAPSDSDSEDSAE